MTKDDILAKFRATGLTDRPTLYQAKENMLREEEKKKAAAGLMIRMGIMFCIFIVPAIVGIPLAIFGFAKSGGHKANMAMIEQVYQEYIAALPA
jgi:hypothetical protein